MSTRQEKLLRKTFPVFLMIKGKQVCIVGGGKVAYRKALLALDSGADVRIVAPKINNKFNCISNRIDITEREFSNSDILNAFMVYAATNNKKLNRSIIDLCKRHGTLSCSVDESWQYGDFITPAVDNQNGITTAVSSGGMNYRKANFISKELSKHAASLSRRHLILLGTSYNELGLSKLHELKKQIRDAEEYLLQVKGLYELVLLNTCNRIELFGVADTDDPYFIELIKRILHFDRLGPDSYYLYKDRKAFIYSCKVVSGLYSQIRGEYHIVSQFKEAVNRAVEKKECGNILKTWADSVLNISKKIRAEFSGIIKVKEIEEQSIDFAQKQLKNMNNSTVMVAGTGKLGKGLVTGLYRKTKKLIWVYHRNVPDASDYQNMEICSISEMRKHLNRTDMIITAFASTDYIISRDSRKYFSKSKETLILDLGIPRNVNDNLKGINIRILNMKDIKEAGYSVQSGIDRRVQRSADSVIQKSWSLYEKLKDSLECGYSQQ